MLHARRRECVISLESVRSSGSRAITASSRHGQRLCIVQGRCLSARLYGVEALALAIASRAAGKAGMFRSAVNTRHAAATTASETV